MKRRIAILAVVLGFAEAPVRAQVVAVSQINGTVKDVTGAVIPKAEVKATQAETGLLRTTVTDDTGTYILSNLPVGPYKLEASAGGFRSYVQTGIVLQVNTNPAIHITLEVGSAANSIEVMADAAMVESHTTAVGQVMDREHVVELPLNGRNVTQLIALSGGAVDVSSSSGLVSNKTYPTAAAYSVAGGQGGQTLFVLDGAPHMDPQTNIGLPMPFPDALQEFKVETSSLPANYGTQPGGVVNVLTRSGTNELHGTAFEFLRNYAVNARNFFAVNRDGLKRNQFGGTLGGPAIKNKLFFFGGYQGTKESVAPSANIAYVPTAAMLQGDFTGLASAGCNGGVAKTFRAPLVGNKAPLAALNPVALNIEKMLPVSGDPCGAITFTIPKTDREYQVTGRVDWQKSERSSLFARYFVTDYLAPPYYQGNLLTLSLNNSVGLADRVQAMAVGHTLAISPNIVNTLRLGYERSAAVRYIPQTLPNIRALGSNVTPAVPNYFNTSVTGFFDVVCTGCSPSNFMANDYSFSEDLTMIKGRHQLSLGGGWMQFRENGLGQYQIGAPFTFSGAATGSALADFLTGQPSRLLQSNGQVLNEGVNSPSMYAQDNIRINSRVSANLGLRWDPFLMPYNRYHQANIFDPGWFAAGVKSDKFKNAPAGVLFYGDKGMPGAGYGTGKIANFSPRVGLVFDPRGKGQETIRAGFGMFYTTTSLFLQVATHSPWQTQYIIMQPVGGLSNPFLGYPGGNPFPTPDPPPSSVQFPIFGGSLGAFKLHPNPTHMAQWNLAFQKQLPHSWLVSATYLGNRTVHLEIGEQMNNSIYIPGNCAAGVYGLTAAGPCSNLSNENNRRQLILANPTQGQYYALMNFFGDAGIATYNGLLTSIQHRFTGGFTVLANHTWSHCLATGEVALNGAPQPQDPNNARAEYANCASDRRQIFNLSMVARSPKVGSLWVQRITRDWQVAPIFTARSGAYLTVATGVDTSLTGTTTRPNLTGNPNLASPTIQAWFNVAAFTSPGPGLYGNLGRSTIVGPGAWNLDIAVSRSLAVRERHTVEIRAEAFNMMNHTRFGNPTTAMNAGGFGRITSAADPRIMQFAVKYRF